MKWAFIYHFFGLLWTNQVIVGFTCVTIAGEAALGTHPLGVPLPASRCLPHREDSSGRRSHRRNARAHSAVLPSARSLNAVLPLAHAVAIGDSSVPSHRAPFRTTAEPTGWPHPHDDLTLPLALWLPHALAGAIATYYFASGVKSEMPTFPVLASMKNTLIYHMGSVAFGGFVIAIVQLIR